MADRPSDFISSAVVTVQANASAALSATVPTHAIYSVSKLNREVRLLLESGVGQVWVQGEISNLARPSSGHWYFSLKDRDAQLRCAMFRARNGQCRFTPREGQAVVAYGRVSLYEPRGDYQLLIEHLDDAGFGALRRSFDELKVRLAAEGLFATEHKRKLPLVPRRIGVITSPTGAAIRDVLHILARRFPAAAVLVYPVPVQGASAAPAIVAALDLASARAECDVLILTRGGGSLEDLWAFNDERVARAIYRCAIPVVTGIGHEIDFTIADFVADLRAPTPSGAAELVAPDGRAWLHKLSQLGQRLDELEGRLRFALQAGLAAYGARLESAARALQGVSPLATLDRGFAVITRSADGALVTAAAQLSVGETFDAKLAQGSLH